MKNKLLKVFMLSALGASSAGLILPAITSCGKTEDVHKDVHISSIYFEETSIELDLDVAGRNTYQLVAHIQPKEAAEKFKNKIQWTSTQESVATVKDGLVTAKAEGSTVVKATVDGKSASCNVAVSKSTPDPEWKNYCVGVTANKDSSINFYQDATSQYTPNLVYSIDDGKTWNEMELDQPINIPSSTTIYLKGNNPNGWDIYDTMNKKWTQAGNILIEGDISLSGSIMGLIDNGANSDFQLPDRCFSSLFKNSTGITSVATNFLPSTKLGTICYNGLFSGCTSLTNAPELPATTLQTACYASMFQNCESLITAPNLPAEELVEHCYQYMFENCKNLQSIKIMYTGTKSEAPNDAFLNWVNDIGEDGIFYYNGNDKASNFGFINWDTQKFDYLHNGSTLLIGDKNANGSDSKTWEIISSSDNYSLIGWELANSNSKINVNQGKVSWDSSLAKGIYEFRIIAMIQYDNETHPIISSKITLVIYDDATHTDSLQVGWVGHRGTPTEYFESSIESFEYSANDPKYWGIETDIHITKDDQIVCVHDSDCFWNQDKTSKDSNKIVENLTYNEIKNEWLINGLSDFPHDCKTHQYIPPLLEEYLSICYEHNKVAVIEIKNKFKWGDSKSYWPAKKLDIFWNKLIPWIKKGLNFNLISFDNNALKYMIEKYDINPKHFQMLINGSADSSHEIHNDLAYFLDNNFSIDCTDWQIGGGTPNIFDPASALQNIMQFHNKGLQINIYTIDNLSKVEQLISSGVDFITSNYPYDHLHA
ncbi:MAG: Ig-like domain-containing protein [Mycoplasma sp.]|nr:Ig-like domain-containing protein [Mycoplasma sp.]